MDGLVHRRGFAVKETLKSGGFLKFVPVFLFFIFFLGGLLCFFRDVTLFYAALFSSLISRKGLILTFE